MKKFLVTALLFYAVFSFVSCSTTATCYGPLPGSVARYISVNGTDLSDYPLSCLEPIEDFNFHEREYNVYENSETVWRFYRRTEPRLAFEGRIIDFGLLFNPDDSAVYTRSEPSPFFAEQQIYVLNLKALGVYNFPVAFQVTRIDNEEKMIEFIYMQENIANGFQRIYFEESFDEKGRPVTHIRHISFFKSSRRFQDKVLYPPFHQQTIDDFHRNVLKANRLTWTKI